MNIFLTMDYEVFFGDKSGSVEKCMIEPTNLLLDLAKKNNFRFTFFWDVGHFLALEKFKTDESSLEADYQAIDQQVKRMVKEGHEVQLHIHPHWEMANWNGTEWQMNLDKHYKLSDFEQINRESIFSKYKAKLEEVTGLKSTVFRAGGWCIQPFTDFKDLFEKHEITCDSSVLPGISWKTEQYNLDFKSVHSQEPYRFDVDVCQVVDGGKFLEIPISSRFYSPLFYWKLYGLGRISPSEHKMWGDGNFVAQPGGKSEMLLKGKMHHISTDGYFASELEYSFLKLEKSGRKTMCIIGHPKSLTKYALKKIDTFTTRNRESKRFMTLSEAK